MSLPYIRIPTARQTDADKWKNSPEQEAEAFYSALGKFVVAWADVENAIYEAIIYYSKVSEPVARALFSGSRARTMMSQLIAIAENTRVSSARRADLTTLSSKVSALNTARDRLAHHGSYVRPGPTTPMLKRRISNENRSSRYNKGFVEFVGSEDLQAQVHECLVLRSALDNHLKPGPFRSLVNPGVALTKGTRKK